MLVKISNLKMPIDAGLDEVFSEAAKRLPAKSEDIASFRVLRRAIDARHGSVHFVYTIAAELKCDISCDGNNIIPIAPKQKEAVIVGVKKLSHRPVIVGFGPCGMFCALNLARQGYQPIVIERGGAVEERTKAVERFWQTGVLDANTNVQFGEGGAGTFSDGKLTTRIGDAVIDDILQEFVRHGAPEDILYHAMPHIGTDVLKHVVKSIREEIILLGGEVRFNTVVKDICIENGVLTKVYLSDGEELPCAVLVLAIGHSARDTYEMLFSHGVSMEQKPFSVGFRVEHLREEIDRAMYGDFAGHPLLGAAPYQLSYREGERGCYSFCMCPGGFVVNASSEQGHLVVNGMSNRGRDNINSNSAICVSVLGKDFKSAHPLDGVALQRTLEQAAFSLGGGDFSVPVQRLGDYIDGAVSKRFGTVYPSVLPRTRFADLNQLLPIEFNQFMKKGFASFGKKIKGFDNADALLTGMETRTSAPLRIVRNENLESVSAKGLYPAGEGAGYAGGIMSAAADGLRIASRIIRTYQPF